MKAMREIVASKGIFRQLKGPFVLPCISHCRAIRSPQVRDFLKALEATTAIKRDKISCNSQGELNGGRSYMSEVSKRGWREGVWRLADPKIQHKKVSF